MMETFRSNLDIGNLLGQGGWQNARISQSSLGKAMKGSLSHISGALFSGINSPASSILLGIVLGRVVRPCTLVLDWHWSYITVPDCILDSKYYILWFEGEEMANNIAQNSEDQPVPEEIDIKMEQCESDESDYESNSD